MKIVSEVEIYQVIVNLTETGDDAESIARRFAKFDRVDCETISVPPKGLPEVFECLAKAGTGPVNVRGAKQLR